MTRFLSSLRFCLMMLGILVILPMIGLVLYNGAQLRELAVADAEEDALRLAYLAANNQDALIEGARQKLITLSLAPDIQDNQTGDCDAFLAELLSHYPSYSNIVVAMPNGDVVCGGLPRTEAVNLADRAYFQRVLQTRDLAVSEYLIARGPGKRAIVTLAYPVLDDAHQIKRILVVGLNLDWMNQLAEFTALPPDSSLTVIDHNGTILTRYPDHEKYVGKTFDEAPIVKIILESETEGTTQAVSVDGTDRMYTFYPLGNPSQPIGFIFIGIPTAVVFADADRLTDSLLIGLVVMTALAFTVMWVFSDVFLLRRMRALVDAAKQVGKGDFSARTGLKHDLGELGVLARTFDEMAVELQLREDERKQAEEELTLANEETVRRLQNIQALRKIDQAIAGSLDLNLILRVVLEQTTTQLNVDAATVLLVDPNTQTLEFAAGIGFRSKAIERSRLRLGEVYVGRAAFDCKTVSIPNLLENTAEFIRTPLITDEGLVTYFGAPLIAKGQVKGVLEVFHRAPFIPDQEWLDFLEGLAGQTAVAVDNTTLFADLQNSNVKLLAAYDSSIEGWSRALDLRDKETEGHTQRVSEMTLELARAAGIAEEELVHIRRGALLHDIGKMGIPDHILLKPDKLTEEEWVVMRKHPIYAFELLSPIEYLRPAIEIPYCHHEKWDGSGYPRGLKGEQIPLAARIFAVVDVWDALRSDRPYRPAWLEDKVLEHIQSLSGAHFDPVVVEHFLDFMREKKRYPLIE